MEKATIAEKEAQYNLQSQVGAAIGLQEKQDLFTLTLEADNVFIEFQKVDSYRIVMIKHELTQFCQSLRIIESTITITKEEE